jgi:SpoVK/Ycf46/Vps4 family AAA+-type ATPase
LAEKSAFRTRDPWPSCCLQAKALIELSDMVLPEVLASRLTRILLEYRQQARLRAHGLRPRRKILLIGPPGSGKTMTAAALAGELHLPFSTILLEGIITKFMGETAAKLKLVFDAISASEGVYLFDEFDALGAKRTQSNDVGEIRRVLNTFLQLLEKDDSNSLIIAATNHPELLDRALFRRFDDVLEYGLPDEEMIRRIITSRLATFAGNDIDWKVVVAKVRGLSQADVSRAAEDAVKHALLQEQGRHNVQPALSTRRTDLIFKEPGTIRNDTCLSYPGIVITFTCKTRLLTIAFRFWLSDGAASIESVPYSENKVMFPRPSRKTTPHALSRYTGTTSSYPTRTGI